MKYFFLAYAIIAALFIGLMPMRGEKRAEAPLWLFPDMDRQDKLLGQEPDEFFADGVGARHPVTGTHPRGFLESGETDLGGIPEHEFGGGAGYYHTGGIGDYFATGMPEELGLTEENVDAFLRRGQEAYGISCTPCHGASGDGLGIATSFGVPGVANLLLENFGPDAYPDGRMFDVISNGKGNMGAYRHNLSLRDRWAVIAYVRALQASRTASLDDEEIRSAFEEARTRGEVE